MVLSFSLKLGFYQAFLVPYFGVHSALCLLHLTLYPALFLLQFCLYHAHFSSSLELRMSASSFASASSFFWTRSLTILASICVIFESSSCLVYLSLAFTSAIWPLDKLSFWLAVARSILRPCFPCSNFSRRWFPFSLGRCFPHESYSAQPH